MQMYLEVTIMNTNELLRRYAAGEWDFCGTNLSGVDLSWKTLQGVNLSEANLSGANLIATDLS
jgi:uncharacterized protein YjbI with pentapeptide repeats